MKTIEFFNKNAATLIGALTCVMKISKRVCLFYKFNTLWIWYYCIISIVNFGYSYDESVKCKFYVKYLTKIKCKHFF